MMLLYSSEGGPRGLGPLVITTDSFKNNIFQERDVFSEEVSVELYLQARCLTTEKLHAE